MSRLWSRYGWQVSVALLLSMLSILAVTESSALEWLGWFGTIGSWVGILILRVGGFHVFALAMAIGFVVNVAFIAAVLVGVSRLASRFVRRVAVEQ